MSKRVLIVDDDPSIRVVLEGALAGDGYDVVSTDDGTGAFDLITESRFDLVVLDLYMPGMNGFELLRHIREPGHGLLPARQTPRSVKVLVISAHSDPATMTFVLKRGADTCLAKPFDLSDLLQATRQLLAPARARGRR